VDKAELLKYKFLIEQNLEKMRWFEWIY
jgi:hypothetical protein